MARILYQGLDNTCTYYNYLFYIVMQFMNEPGLTINYADFIKP